jgi:choline dehydrogenase-like flavoprotein
MLNHPSLTAFSARNEGHSGAASATSRPWPPALPARQAIIRPEKQSIETDVAIIGSGPGGGTLAYSLRNSGARILLIEKGDFLPSEPENWSPRENFQNLRYKANTRWIDASTGKEFRPNLYQFVGGCSKVWGTALVRMRPEDFGELKHQGGVSPAWPITYDDISRYYDAAEKLYGAHGRLGNDPTAPPGQPEPPYPFVGHAPTVARIVESMAAQGTHPVELPVGVDYGNGGKCVLCSTCDGFPCRLRAKNDAEMRAVRPALESPDVKLSVRTAIDHLITSPDGRRVVAAVGEQDGVPVEVRADRFVVSAGAANSAALLLKSATPEHPQGLANSSGHLGRNYMQHIFSAILAVDPRRKTEITFQKTAAINDFYLSGRHGYPLGNIQGLGKLHEDMLKAGRPWAPLRLLKAMSEHGTDWWATTEDLPDPENRVTVTSSGQIKLAYRKNNLLAHRELVKEAKKLLHGAGFPFVFTDLLPIEATAAQCGTARFGEDPKTSVLDPLCRTHDVENLWVVDGSFMPSASAQNPGLTIAAQALRVGHLAGITG